MNQEDHSASDIAIIGYAARFPGATNAEQFWANLCHGVESIRSFTVKELESIGVSKEALRDPDYVRAGAPLSHLDAFDAAFFGISPREAAIMDPQQRFFLECAWEALEHAGYAPGTFKGSTGVFAGSGPNSYLFENLLSDRDLVNREGIFLLRHTGNDKDVLATRVSYQMDLRGPSMNVQTACSTSLVAVHYACQSLLHLGCDLALAGAVSIEVPHAIGYQYRQNEIQSQDGHCRAFDANASGTVFGSGLGLVILRRLTDAIEDGDTIHAVIKGTAVNNDGSRKVGFLAPSVEGQVEVIQEALGAAGVPPETVDFVETHGTATPIGDPIELSALSQAFAGRKHPLKIGSVKSNIGHLDTAAGMAGLLKTVLTLQRRQIPPTLHYKNLNPLIDTGKTKLEVIDQLTDWKDADGPRRAGVTSLGIGGTNAHIILEEPPAVAPAAAARPAQLITLSAKTTGALDDATRALAAHLRGHPELDLADAAYTLHAGRNEFNYRRAFVAHDRAGALQRLELPHAAPVVTGKAATPPAIAFLFSGQGSQYVNMGRELYQAEPVFREWIDTCAVQARAPLGFDFRELLFPSEASAAKAAQEIMLTWNAQPILFAVEYALAQLWMSWGVRPSKLIGHSLGEYTAACLAGVFTLEDAVAIVCARGNLMRKVTTGAMLAVSLSEKDVAPWVKGSLALASVNAPDQCVISGPTADITALKAELDQAHVASHRLETSHAFHSSAIDPVLEAFVALVREKKLSAPKIPLISNVTGKWMTEKEATDPAYWGRHFRQTVRFAAGLQELQTGAAQIMLEIGPGEALGTLGRHVVGQESPHKFLPSLPRVAARSGGDLGALLTALGTLWVDGAQVDWTGFHAGEKRRRVPLPTYSFQRKRFWMGPKIGTNWLEDSLEKVDDWFYRTTWKAAPLPVSSAASSAVSTDALLVLGDATPDGRKVLDELRRQRATVISVTAGEKFAVLGDDAYTLNPASSDDFAALFDQLAQHRQTPRQIAHLWALATTPASAEDRCFQGLLALIQTLGARLPDQGVALTAISHRSISHHREPVLHPHGALLAGHCRVAPLEYPNLRCRQVDLETTEPAALASILLREGESDTAVNLAVYRDGTRWTQDVERVRLEPAPDRLRERGTYLITGGLGGLGMAVADSLARTHHARLVLLSRHAESLNGSHESRFDEWRRLGAEVLPLSADVTDRASLQAALARAREQFGNINGIIHAAGVLQDGIIQLKKKDVAHRVLAPKMAGVELLDELTQDEPLDFFALFSSVSALTPPDGQVDYCAANAFLNAYAQSKPAGRNFIVIGWGPWSEIGMVAPKVETDNAPFRHPLLERIEIDSAARTVYSGTLSVERHWVLAEHRFHAGSSLLPGTAYIELAVSALWKKIGRQPVTLENVVFLAPLKVAPKAPVVVHAELQKTRAGYQFSVTANDTTYGTGFCHPTQDRPQRLKLQEIRGRCPVEKRDGPKNIRQRGHFDFGPHWQSLRSISFGKDECLGTLELPAEFQSETHDFVLHPALMDIATGVAMYLAPGYDKVGDLMLPFAYKRLTIYGVLPARLYSHARLKPEASSDLLVCDITLAGENGEVIAEVEDFTIKRLRGLSDLVPLDTDAVPFGLPLDDPTEPLTGIPTREGLEAFLRLLKSGTAEVTYVSPTKLSFVAPMRESEPMADAVTTNTDDIDLVLGQLWQRLLGLDEVDAKTDFFDSGGHSLLAVRLFTEIRKRFNINFGLSTLFEARTIGALADLIRKARETDPGQKGHVVTPGLVPIRSRGTNTPLFLVHDVGGSVLRYEHLARQFPEDQAIYAIESRGLSGLPTDFAVEDMARHYIQQIRERQPQGPYYVAGHSFGGLVAYEIARQLAALGETMGLVGLLDTYQRPLVESDYSSPTQPAYTGKLPLFQRLTTDLRNVFLGRDRIGYLQERGTYIQAWAIKTTYRTAHKMSKRLGLGMPRFLNDAKEANWIASDYYTPGGYDGEVVLFRCQHRVPTDPPDSSHIWRRLVTGDVEIIDVPGDHNSMLREPNVKVLAEQILTYLRPAGAPAAAPVETATR